MSTILEVCTFLSLGSYNLLTLFYKIYTIFALLK